MAKHKVFISYSHIDAAQTRRLQIHLDPLRRDGTIDYWYDSRLQAGEKFRHVIEMEMDDATMAIMLVSPYFLASEFCQDVEAPFLLRKYEKNETLIIPIIIDHCNWEIIDWLSNLHVLPPNRKPVRSYRPQSKAWTEVCHQIRKLAQDNPRSEFATPLPAKLTTDQRNGSLLSLQDLLEELPGGTDELFGRDEDLKLLDEAFHDPTISVVTFVAFGGVGKSALVRYWLAQRFADSNVRFIGCSFYSQGTRERAGTSDQFIVSALRALGDPDPNRGSLQARGRRLAELVTAQSTILVLDGLEPLQFGFGADHREGNLKDVGIRELLAGLLEHSGQSLCIVTSRLALTDNSLRSPRLVSRHLDVLPLFAARETLRYRGVRGTDAELDQAANYLGRHALALVLAAEYLDTFEEGQVRAISRIPLIDETIKSGRHAKSVMVAYEMSLRRDGNMLDLELLYLLGLFDRPVLKPWLDALRKEPIIPGVTSHVVKASELEIWEAISRLRQWGLMTPADVNREDDLDAHPLIREYFGEMLRKNNEAGWRAAHKRLFEHLAETSKDLPDTLDDMIPLLLGVVHGCQAGCYRSALHEIYIPRIMRGEYYAARKLGALGLLLSVLAHFFEPGRWDRPVSKGSTESEGLSETDQVMILTHAGTCLTAAKGYADLGVESCYAKARDLCMRAGETRDLFVALFGLWRHYLVRGAGQETRELITKLYSLGQKLNDHSALAAAERVMCTSYYFGGQNALAAHHAEKGFSLQRPENMLSDAQVYLNEPTITCLGYWALALWHLGDPDQARQKIKEAVQQSRDLGHAHTLTISLLYDAMISQFCRQAEQTRDKATALIRLCAREGFSLWQIAGEVLHGWALSILGHEEAGINQLETSLVNWKNHGAELFRLYWLALLAEAHGRTGQIAKGIRAVDEGLQLSELNGETWWQSDLYRLKGELLQQSGTVESSDAEGHLLKAVEIAQQQGAKSFELRAIIACSKFWSKANRREEAQVRLRAIYEEFDGGHDTGDLQEAKAILNELALSKSP